MLTDCQLLGGSHVFTLVENALDVVGITTVDDSNWNSHQQNQQEQLHSVDINQQTCGIHQQRGLRQAQRPSEIQNP